jgi:hemerythrin
MPSSSFMWNDSFKIGIPTIDQQHKQLIDQMNLLVSAMQNNQGKEEIAGIIQFLDRYIQQHFGYEENCMERYRCPIAAQNKAAHSEFIANFEEIKAEFNKNGASLLLVMKVNQNLLDWFINHIKKIDVQLKPCMNN